ncbi:MAG TPA: hypothetical protein PK306_10335 [Aquabacterium sp.]|nr:hypothetical protein [Aquabacterium sp.]
MLLALAWLAATGVHLLRGHDVELRVFRATGSGPQPTPAVVRTLSTGAEQSTDPTGRLRLHLSHIQLPISVSVRALEGGDSSDDELKSLPTSTWDITLPALAPKQPDPAPPPLQGFQRLFAGTPLLQSPPRPETVDDNVWSRSHLLLLTLPVVIAVLWSAYWALRRRAWLTRLPKQQAGRLRELSSRARQTLNAALDGGRAAHELRRRRWQPSATLNVEATLRASVERPQAPTLVFGSRVEPEYLVLIDESSTLDHLARLADELMLSLQARDVALARYFFTDSPLWCHGPAEERKLRKPGLPEVALEALQGSHGGHRLIVVSDGRPLFHAGTGAPMPCMEQLLRWPDPVLLTPTRRERWGRREWALSRQGFTVLPLNAEGLRLLGELQGSDRPVPLPGAEAASRPPPRWVLEPLSLLLPTPPTVVTPAALCDELRAHLGDDAFIWLQGCAIYPEIHWGITLRIGAGLLGTDARLARALVPLVRLPWLRDSHMPNWLREALRARMTPADWAQVSHVIDQILDSVREDRQGNIPLQIATPAGTPGLLQRLRQRWQAWRRATRTPSSQPSREAPVPPARRLTRDPVFLRFLQGPPSLGVPAADALRRLFFTEGLWTLGTKALPLVAVALIASGGLAWQFPPRQVVSHVVDRPPVAAPAATALAVEPGASAPGVLVAYDNSELWRVEAAGATRQAALKSIAVTGLQALADGRRLLRLGSDRSVTLPARPLAGGSEAELDLEVGRLFSSRDGRQTARLAADGRSLEVAQAGSAPRRIGLPASEATPLCIGVGSGNTVAIGSARSVDMVGIVGEQQVASVPLPATEGCVLPPDGETMFGWQAPSDGRVAVWRLDLRRRQMGTPLSLAGAEPIVAAAASADGRLLWLLRGNTVEAFDGSSGASLGTLPTSATQLGTSADGLLLALSSPGGQMELWQREPLQPEPLVGGQRSDALPGSSNSTRTRTVRDEQETGRLRAEVFSKFPNATVGVRYGVKLFSGGAPPVEILGTRPLPPGLKLRGRMLEGIPTVPGTYIVDFVANEGETDEPVTISEELLVLPKGTAGPTVRTGIKETVETPAAPPASPRERGSADPSEVSVGARRIEILAHALVAEIEAAQERSDWSDAEKFSVRARQLRAEARALASAVGEVKIETAPQAEMWRPVLSAIERAEARVEEAAVASSRFGEVARRQTPGR